MKTTFRVSYIFLLIILSAICSLAPIAIAQVPRTISYQGVLANGGAAANGKHLLTVALYDSLAGGTMLYQESQEITISGGIFNIDIGSQSPIPQTLMFDRQYYLAVSVDGNPEMTPRSPLSTAPYSLGANIAELAEGLTPNAQGVVTSINELSGQLRITGDSITTVTENGNDIIIHARATPGSAYTAGQGISISNDVISASGGLPAGAVLNSTLRWNGTLWTENPNMTSDANGNTRINGSTTLGNATGNDSITMDPGTGAVKINGFGAGVVKSSANGTLSSGLADLTTDVTGVLPVIHGGTGSGILSSGQLLMGNGTNPVTSTQLTAGTGISIAQSSGNITITNTGSVGWALNGNASTSPPGYFLGTTDNQAFEIHIYDNDAGSHGSRRAMRYEPNLTSPNLIGGYQGNGVGSGVVGAVIGGGGLNGFNNTITDDFSFVGGGSLNRAGDNAGSTADASHATVGGGGGNTASALYASITGGDGNTASGLGSSIIGGNSNMASGVYSTVTGGGFNIASGNGSVAGGGYYSNPLNIFGNAALGGASTASGGVGNIAAADFSTVSGGMKNSNFGQRSAIAGGGWLGLGGAGSFGFHNGTSASDSAYVSSAATAFFGNVNLWLGNTNNSASQLRLYSAQNGGVVFPAASTHYSSFAAGAQSSDINYTLPLTSPAATGNLILATAASPSVMSWSTNLVWDNINYRLGVNTTTPAHPVHSVNAATTDEIAALYGIATASSTNQAIGVWGRANNSSSSNTGTIGVLATGNGNTTAGQTNVALQLNDGEFAVGRTTESPSVGSDVDPATGGTAYSQQGPSGVVELTLGSSGNLQTSAPTSGVIQDLGSITINNRYAENGSVVLTNIVAMIDDGVAPNPQNAAFIVNADNTASGSFVIRVKMIPAVTSSSNYSSSDKIRVGYVIVNKSK